MHPSTNHRQVDHSTHDTEVSIEEECCVQITGSTTCTVEKARPLYNFPLHPDMLAFQCALRGKLIRHTFEVDSIRSKCGKVETSHQHLKMWSDFSDENYTLSFYVKKGKEPGTHLEFPVECFEPRPAPRQDNPELVRMYFRLPPKPPKLSRTPKITSPQSSFRRKFSRNRQTQENPPPQSPPTGGSSHRCREISIHFM
jgi:hypothetical protein